MAGFQADLLYDATAFSIADPRTACTVAAPGYHGAVYATLSPSARATSGGLRVLVVDFSSARDMLGDGTVILCELEAAESAAGSHQLSLDNVKVVSAGGETMSSTAVGAEIEIPKDCVEAP